ncbi:MAG TPA: DHA2 family efflux MFS transporter permease subunit, partial [Chloroflexota bacterium]|nr:DHA2 family efflux MFS transporter permease subunit [Chloroflexota bacterium]
MSSVGTARERWLAESRGRAADGRPGQPLAYDGRYKWTVLVTVVFGAFASILDSTIVNTALPQIQQDFKANLHLASYVATGYILAAGVVVPASAYLANRFGIKRVYLVSLTVFTAGSVLCGLAPSMVVLIAFRVLQGAGGAGLFSLSFALLFAAFAQSERGKANGVFGIPVLVAPTIGPTLGGYLTQYVDWRWIFFVNLPIGIACVFGALAYLHESRDDQHGGFDWPGFVFLTGGLFSLVLALLRGNGWGWGSGRTLGLLAAAVVCLGAFAAVELAQKSPMFDLGLFRNPSFTAAQIIAFTISSAMFSQFLFLTLYIQNQLHYSPLQAGLRFLPLSLLAF